MSFFAHIIADFLELPDIPVSVLHQVKRIFLLIMIFAFPTTFALGVQFYIHHETGVLQDELKGVIQRVMTLPATHSRLKP